MHESSFLKDLNIVYVKICIYFLGYIKFREVKLLLSTQFSIIFIYKIGFIALKWVQILQRKIDSRSWKGLKRFFWVIGSHWFIRGFLKDLYKIKAYTKLICTNNLRKKIHLTPFPYHFIINLFFDFFVES